MSKASTNRISDISYPGADRKVKVAIPGIQSLHHRRSTYVNFPCIQRIVKNT